MEQAFSIYAARESRIHRLHPLTKLSLAFFLLVAGLVLPGGWTTYALFGLVVLPLAFWSQVLSELARSAWRVVLPFAISILLVQGLFWPGGTPVFGLGPLTFKAEGLDFAFSSTGRILLVVCSFLWFALTTRPDSLMIALTQRGLPPSLAYIIVATVQIVPRFQARAATILDAQQARGLETQGGLLQRARAVLPLVVPLILSSLVDVEERALAIEARAFNHTGRKTSLTEIGEVGWEPWLRSMVLLGCIGLFGARIWLWLR